MNTSLSIRTIDPLDVAEKLHAVRNFLLPEIEAEIKAEPRLVEALWFLQWISIPENYAGGLARFAEDLLARFADEVGPEELLAHAGKKIPMGSLDAVLGSFHHEAIDALIESEAAAVVAEVLDSHLAASDAEESRRRNAARTDARKKLTYESLHDYALEEAMSGLAGFLFSVCSSPERKFDGRPSSPAFEIYGNPIWYFPRLWKCILAWMDEYAAQVRCKFAETVITKDIFRWLELAQESGKGVMFIGHSRFGKSVAIRSFARMFPGRARIVECPSSSSESDLLREVARCLGIRFSYATSPLHEQRAAIDKVLRQGKFLLIFDEAQFLFPPAGKRSAVPPRLNYVRRSIMDIGIPTAFICTHQNWKQVQKNFLKVSAYSIEQFEGRLLRTPIHLASELSEAEMIEVARIHLPELDDDYLTVIVRPIRSFNGGDHLSSIENIAVIARTYAREAGKSAPSLSDVERATNDVLGCEAVPAAPDPDPDPKTILSTTPESSVVPRKKSTAAIGPRLAARGTRPAGFEAIPHLRAGVLADA